jgi:AraC-like DNA-binding protein
MTMTEVLRTDDLRQAERFDQWRHWATLTCVPLECAPVSRKPFRGELAAWTLGELLITHVHADPHLASRTPRMIAASDEDYFKVSLQVRGRCRMTQDGREAVLQPGDIAIYDCSRPYTMSFDGPFEMSCLIFPHSRLQLPPVAVTEVLATCVPGNESTVSLMAPFLRRLVNSLEHAQEEMNRRRADSVLDMLAAMVAQRTGKPATDPAVTRRSLLFGIYDWIDKNLDMPGLCPETIARASHISVRYLHKLFQDEGTSVARWVRECRLEKCRRDLEDPTLAEREVIAIARRWGFDDAAHFNKIFKATYGMPPGQYRQLADLSLAGLRI